MMIGARTGPVRRVHDVDRALRAGDEETGTAAGDADADEALAAARQVGDEDVLGAAYARFEVRTGRPKPLKLPLDALGDGVRGLGGKRWGGH